MTGIRCPYCGSSDLLWNNIADTVIWADNDAGVIYTRRIVCCDGRCEGNEGFEAAVPFITGGEVEYLDLRGTVIEPSETL